MVQATVNLVMLGLVASIGLCLVRLAKGPTAIDRILAVDTIAINLIALLSAISLQQSTSLYVDAALVIAILGFLSTVALANFVKGGRIHEIGESDRVG